MTNVYIEEANKKLQTLLFSTLRDFKGHPHIVLEMDSVRSALVNLAQTDHWVYKQNQLSVFFK